VQLLDCVAVRGLDFVAAVAEAVGFGDGLGEGGVMVTMMVAMVTVMVVIVTVVTVVTLVMVMMTVGGHLVSQRCVYSLD